MKARGAGQVRCPRCGTQDVRKSLTKSLLDRITGMFALVPVRCRQCRHRFYRRGVDSQDTDSDSR